MPPDSHPGQIQHSMVLSDGARVFIRLIRPADERRLEELYSRLSEHTAYQRFFTLRRRLPPAWYHFFANVDYRRRLALVAEHDTTTGPELVGVGRYEPTDDADMAEVAFVVEDGWQGRGLGTALLDELLAAAHSRGVRRFRAYVLADNHRMLRLLGSRTHVLEHKLEGGVVELTFVPRSEAPAPSGARAAAGQEGR